MRRLKLLLTLPLMTLISGCPDVPIKIKTGGEKGPCNPPPLELFLQADKQVNANANGQAMPVEVRAYLLRDRQAFDRADFEEIWKRADEVLAKDIVKSASLTVIPTKLKIFTIKSSKEANFVALVGIFRKPQNRDWQYVADIREQNRRCADKDSLHTIIHAELKNYTIFKASSTGETNTKPKKGKKKKDSK